MSHPSPEVEARLLGWKNTYGEVIVLAFGGRDYVFRSLTPREWEQVQLATELDDPALTDELNGQMLQNCKLWPEDFDLDDLPITAFTQLYESVQGASPFSSTQAFHDTLQRYRGRTQTMMGAVRAMLGTAFPGLTQEAIGDFNTHQLFIHITLAEQILGTEFQVPGFSDTGLPTSMTPAQARAAKAQQAMHRKQQRRQQQYDNYAGRTSSPSSEHSISQSSSAPDALSSRSVLTAADFEADAAALRKALLDG